MICLIVSRFNLKFFLRYFKQVFSHFLELIPFCALIFLGCIWLFSERFRYCFRMCWRCSPISQFDKKDLLNFYRSSKCLSPLIDAFSIPEQSSLQIYRLEPLNNKCSPCSSIHVNLKKKMLRYNYCYYYYLS